MVTALSAVRYAMRARSAVAGIPFLFGCVQAARAPRLCVWVNHRVRCVTVIFQAYNTGFAFTKRLMHKRQDKQVTWSGTEKSFGGQTASWPRISFLHTRTSAAHG